MDRGLWIGATIGFLAPLVMFSPLNTSQAWFAAWQSPAGPVAAPSAPAAQIVRTRHVADKAGKTREARRNRPAAAPLPVAAPIDPKEQLARTIDPAKRPDWYLIDPTLKRGDVLFLADKVVVFRGRKIGDLADYVPVSGSRMLSRTERRMIERLAARPLPAPVAAAAAPQPRPGKLASASAGRLAAN